MRRNVTWIIVGLLALGTAVAAWTQHDHGDYERERRGARVGQMIVPPGAYLTISPASEAIWQTVGQIQTQLHAGTWELSQMHAQGADEEAIEAKVEQLRALNDQFQAQREALREHIVFPEGMFEGRDDGLRGGGQGGGRGGQGGQR